MFAVSIGDNLIVGSGGLPTLMGIVIFSLCLWIMVLLIGLLDSGLWIICSAGLIYFVHREDHLVLRS